MYFDIIPDQNGNGHAFNFRSFSLYGSYLYEFYASLVFLPQVENFNSPFCIQTVISSMCFYVYIYK